MTWFALSIALQQEPLQVATPQSQWLTGGSVYRGARYRLGVRPAATLDDEGGSAHWGAGLTVQVSTPWF